MKLYENDLLETILKFDPIVVGLLILAAEVFIYVLAIISYTNNRHNGKVGITYFWTGTFGYLILPFIGGFITAFYHSSPVKEGSWLVDGWLSWLALLLALVITAVWLPTAMNHKRGDWTTIPPRYLADEGWTDGGINLYGWFHTNIMFLGTAYLWIDFDLKALFYTIDEGLDSDQFLYTVVISSLIALFVVIGNNDNKKPSPLHLHF